ncbi:hypothetical protein BDV3_004254 [Batrachochytrium dendrobatidis]
MAGPPTTTNNHANAAAPRPPVPVRKERPPSPPPSIYDSKAQTHYTVGALLGEGGFARCYEVLDDKENRFAAKVVYKPSLKSQKQRQKLVSEISIHKSLSHPCIVRFINVFEDDVNVYMILEICENKTFVDMIKKRKRLTDPEIRYYMYQLLDSIRYMHRHGVIHRDIKLGNLFLGDRMQMKIGDFGLAALLKHDGERKKTICGTPNYIAPEVLFNKEGHSFEVDIWSLGIVMYTFAIGKPPFQTKDVNSIYERIRENNLEFPANIPISDDVRVIIKSLLHSDPEQRPSIDDVLEHRFFSTEPILKEIPVSALHTPPIFDTYPKQTEPSNRYTYATQVDTDKLHTSPQGTRHQQMNDKQLQTKSLYGGLVTAISDVRFNEPARALGAVRQSRPESIGLRSPRNPPMAISDPVPLHAVPATPYESVSSQPSKHRLQPVTVQAPTLLRSALQPSPAHGVTPNHLLSPTSKTQSHGVREHSSNSPPDQTENTPTSSSAPTPPSITSSKSSNSKDVSRKSNAPLEELLQVLTNGLYEREVRGTDGMNELANNIAHLQFGEHPLEHPDLFITKWIDYSNKYGLGYQLRDGSVGVYFNDSTSIILASDGFHFEYLYTSKSTEKISMHCGAWNLDSFPTDLTKKVTLLRHFKGYMQENLYRACSTNLDSPPKIVSLEYLTKYLRTKNGVFFRLSNHTLQLNLFDHTKLIISERGEVVTYIDSNREMHTHSLSWFLRHGSLDVIDRISYIRGVIHQILTKKSKRIVTNTKNT